MTNKLLSIRDMLIFNSCGRILLILRIQIWQFFAKPMRLHIHEDQIIKRTMWFYTLRRHNLIQLKKYCIFGLLPGKIFRQTFYFRKILLQKKIRLEISEGVLGNSFSLVCLWWLVFAIWTPLAKNCQIRSQLLNCIHNVWLKNFTWKKTTFDAIFNKMNQFVCNFK